MSTLRDEIKQDRPFSSLEEEVLLNLQRTAEAMAGPPTELLRQDQLSRSQYNVLRILRGAGRAGHSCREIANRMVNRDPDMTRLLDGLEQRELVSRARSEADRRVIVVKVTGVGLRLLRRLDKPLAELNESLLSHMSKSKLEQLNRLLEEARSNVR